MNICYTSLLITFLLMLKFVTPISSSTQVIAQAVPDLSIIVAQTYQPSDRGLPERREGGGTR